MSGQAWLDYVCDINHNIPTTRRWARGDTKGMKMTYSTQHWTKSLLKKKKKKKENKTQRTISLPFLSNQMISLIATPHAYEHIQNNKQEHNKVPFTQVDEKKPTYMHI